MAIYTKTGDYGETSVLGGMRVTKGSNQIRVIGAVDELNSHMGLGVAMLKVLREQAGDAGDRVAIELSSIIEQLQDVQRDLFEVGAALARGEISESRITNHELREEHSEVNSQKLQIRNSQSEVTLDVEQLEIWIDQAEQRLPKLEHFILPGGGVVGAQLMVARSVCRRAERELVHYYNSKFKNQNAKIQIKNQKLEDRRKFLEDHLSDEEMVMLRFLNRLSDYLFVVSRRVNAITQEEEVVWKK